MKKLGYAVMVIGFLLLLGLAGADEMSAGKANANSFWPLILIGFIVMAVGAIIAIPDKNSPPKLLHRATRKTR